MELEAKMQKPLNGAPLLESLSLTPLMLAENSQQLFQSSVQYLLTHPSYEVMAAESMNDLMSDDEDFWPRDSNDWRAAYRPYNVKDGILQIPIMGVLLNKFSFTVGRWATGYKYIEMALKRGLADANVKGIALLIDSPGGEVAGCFELGEKIYAGRKTKPIRAFAADHAYSAAYVMFSSGSIGSVTKSGGVGSIGVVTAHVEYSKMMDDWGVKVTFIFAGKHKVDGNAYEALPKAVKDRIQVRIDKIYGVFTSTVARNRGMEDKDVRATEALTYDAQDGKDIGLSDRIGALEEEMVVFSTEVATGDEFMAVQDNVTGKKPGGGDEATGIDQATHDAAVASATAEGQKAGATAEKARITGILASEEGQKRPKAALSAALKTDMTVEQASAFLADLAEEKAEVPQGTDAKGNAKRDHFGEAMGKTPTLNAGEAGEGGDEDPDSPEAKASSILAAYGREAGTGPKKKSA